MVGWWAAVAGWAGGDPARIALDAVRDDHVPYAVWQVIPWAGGARVLLQPTLGGEPVEGALRVVSVGVHGEVRRVRGPVVADAALPAQGPWTSAQAVERARWLVHGLQRSTEEAWEPRAARVAIADRDGHLHRTWAVDLSAGAGRSFRLYVDDASGAIVQIRPTSFDVRGNVYETNPVASAFTEVDLPRLTDDTFLSGEHAWVQSCDDYNPNLNRCDALSSHAVPDVDGNYLFADDATSAVDPQAEVQMYYQLDKVAQWYEDSVGYFQPAPMQGIVNFSLQNAFYGDADGDGIGEVAFGQDAVIDFAYDGDVVYHEFTHSVIGTVTQLSLFGADEYGIDFAPMGLNEGSADLFSVLITGDPALGEYSGAAFGLPAIRDLDADKRCPYDLYGEGHEDGMIWGSAGWNMISDPAIGSDVVADLIYGAVTTWGSTMTWSDAGQSVADSADDLLAASVIDQPTRDAIQAHLDASGLVGCERVIPLEGDTTSTQFTIYAGLADALGPIPVTAQFSLTPDADTTALKFKIDDWFTTNPGHVWTIFVRRGEHVVHDVQSVLGLPVPIPSVYDFSVDGEGSYTLELSADSDPPLELGETYYFSIASRNDGTLSAFDIAFGEVTVSGNAVKGEPTTPSTPTDTTSDPTPTEPDPATPASGEDPAEDKGGCGCAHGGAHGAIAGLALAALGARRRRR